MKRVIPSLIAFLALLTAVYVLFRRLVQRCDSCGQTGKLTAHKDSFGNVSHLCEDCYDLAALFGE